VTSKNAPASKDSNLTIGLSFAKPQITAGIKQRPAFANERSIRLIDHEAAAEI
jgi:hypothetical protein